MDKLTWIPSASYSPFVTLFVASNPNFIARLVLAIMNTKHQRDCNINMAIYLNQLNQ